MLRNTSFAGEEEDRHDCSVVRFICGIGRRRRSTSGLEPVASRRMDDTDDESQHHALRRRADNVAARAKILPSHCAAR